MNTVNEIQHLHEENVNMTNSLQEWKTAFNEKAQECEQNRDKYFEAQQLAEEYRRQLEIIRALHDQNLQRQINAELQESNKRFKAQLDELGHLPFILEAKQLELEDTHAKLKLAEKTISALSVNLEACIVKCEMLQSVVKRESMRNSSFIQEVHNYRKEINEWELKYDTTSKENEFLLKSVEKMKFLEDSLERKTKEVHEIGQHVDQLKDESSRHIMRIKERTESQKRAFQAQIGGLEKELVQLKSNLSTCTKERDEIRQRLQAEILKLEQNFGDAQLEIKSLQNHVDILKASYANIFDETSDDDHMN